MKKICLILLTIFFIISCISCNDKQEIDDNNSIGENNKLKSEKDDKFTPYSWVCLEPLKPIDNTKDLKGTWEDAKQYYEARLRMGGVWNDKKLSDRFLLSIDVMYCNPRNIRKDFYVNISPSGEKPEEIIQYVGDFIYFQTYNRTPEESSIYESENKVKKEINIGINIKEGFSLFYFTAQNNPRLYLYEKIFLECVENENDIVDLKGACISNSHLKSLLKQSVPLNIDGSLFTTNTPYKEYYKSSDLEITGVDIYGNISGRFGGEEFTIGPGEEWSSKRIKNALPRKWFEYDWPKYENGNWVYDDRPTISICAFSEEMINGHKKWESTGWLDLKTNDEYLIKIAHNNKNYYSQSEFKKIYEYIRSKHHDFKLNFDIDKYEKCK
ncbi:MAG: hypothetical protein PHV06_10530, partial [bacterium]|nr:hypothetical protein [bacterium]